MKKNYFLIIGILLLLLVGGCFAMQEFSLNSDGNVIDYNKVTKKNQSNNIEIQRSNNLKKEDGLILIKSTTQENENKGVKSINKAKLYKLNDYDIHIIEKQIVEKNLEPVEESVLTELLVFQNNIEIQNHEFKGNLISIGAQLDGKLLLQFEDVWNEGDSIYEYSFENNSINNIAKNDFKFIETSDSVGLYIILIKQN